MKLIIENEAGYLLEISDLKTNCVYKSKNSGRYYSPVTKAGTAEFYLLDVSSNVYHPYNKFDPTQTFKEVRYSFKIED